MTKKEWLQLTAAFVTKVFLVISLALVVLVAVYLIAAFGTVPQDFSSFPSLIRDLTITTLISLVARIITTKRCLKTVSLFRKEVLSWLERIHEERQ